MKLCLFLLTAAVLAIIPSYTFAAPGALDTTFGGGYFTAGIGQATTILPYTQMAIQPNGKIIIAANTGGPSDIHISLYRFNANGSRDMTFGTGGEFTLPQEQVDYTNWSGTNMMTLQPDGKILVIASRGAGCVVSRVNPNGSMDNSFGGTGAVTTTIVDGCAPTTVRVQSDGKIVVAGMACQAKREFL